MIVSAGKSILAILTVLLLNSAGCIAAPAKQDVLSDLRPEIIEVFACGDYCPGPREQYLVKAYKGVNTREECLRIGGQPHEYVGWGKHFVCIAE
ncbi:MAG TPA: hypothetical protein DIC36_02170 [Gammaproteobacteria bacterium]|nr:hypothetical protein [Gammaproteobacteria bacterium]